MVAASDIKLYVMLAVYDKQHAGTLATGGEAVQRDWRGIEDAMSS